MKKFLLVGAVASSMILGAVLPASAAVTLHLGDDPSTPDVVEVAGTGFVGKGDVQTPWGLNNAQMNAAASGVRFAYEESVRYEATCVWTTGEGTKGEKTHDVTLKRRSSVRSTVAYEQRRNGGNGNLTGFILNGFENTATTGHEPVVGQPCVSENSEGVAKNGTWTQVTQVGTSDAHLLASLDGRPVIELT